MKFARKYVLSCAALLPFAAITMGTTFITYKPPSTTYNSSDRFTYTIKDPGGKTATGTVYVNVSANGVTTVY